MLFDNRIGGTATGGSLNHGLPLIREQLPEAINGMRHNAPKHIIKIFPGIDFTCFAGLDKSEEKGRGPGTAITAREQPVLPAQGKGTDSILSRVVVRFKPTIIKVTVQGLTLI